MPKPVPFVVFSDDWGEHPSSCQHLFRRIAPNHPTLWVNTVGLRPPRLSLSDARRAASKIGRWIAPVRSSAPSEVLIDSCAPTVIAPPMVPWMRPSVVRAANRASVRVAVARACQSLGFTRPVLVITVPNGVDAIGAAGERSVVYYCVDDFTRWPGVDGEAAAAMETELLARADRVIATSEHLAATRMREGRPTAILPHGVDIEHFARASDPATRPIDGIRRGRPVLGYVGLIDERTDGELLANMAAARPDWDIVLIGPVDRPPPALLERANIRLLPAVPYARVPEALAAFDVAILPYRLNELTRSINPLKLREYLASGRPVVATPLAEVRAFEPHVKTAGTAAAFVAAALAAQEGPRDLRAAREAVLRGQGWDERAARFVSWCLASDRSLDGTDAPCAASVEAV